MFLDVLCVDGYDTERRQVTQFFVAAREGSVLVCMLTKKCPTIQFSFVGMVGSTNKCLRLVWILAEVLSDLGLYNGPKFSA